MNELWKFSYNLPPPIFAEVHSIFMAVTLTLIQISSAYLRYLPFSRELSSGKIYKLRKYFLLWSLAGLIINFCIFSNGINYLNYKIATFPGWIPYFIISVLVIENKFLQHVFILGMQCLWTFMLHAFAGMGVALIYGTMSEEFLYLQLIFYLLLFFALFKIERNFFLNLLPNPSFFEDKKLKIYISILPFAIFVGTLISISDVTFLPTWRERLSNATFPIFFFLIYQSLSAATRQVAEEQLQAENARLLSQQVKEFEEHNSLMQKNQREVVEIQKNLLNNYRTIDKFLEENKPKEAIKFIEKQTDILDSTRVKVFCLAPLVNVALSIYLKRAKEIGVKVSHKVDLPPKFATDESDLAVLLSNLLENAINASKKQNPSEREIAVTIRHNGKQYILDISNRYNYPLKLDENGLPYTKKIGHGIGMASLKNFVGKYNAFVDFSQENNFVRVSMYWNDYLEAK